MVLGRQKKLLDAGNYDLRVNCDSRDIDLPARLVYLAVHGLSASSEMGDLPDVQGDN
jgi:hypothetical protein